MRSNMKPYLQRKHYRILDTCLQTYLMIKAERGEHQRHECGDGLHHAVLERPKLGEAKEGAAVGHGALQDQPERPGVLRRRTLLQDIHHLSKPGLRADNRKTRGSVVGGLEDRWGWSGARWVGSHTV